MLKWVIARRWNNSKTKVGEVILQSQESANKQNGLCIITAWYIAHNIVWFFEMV